MNLNTQLVVIGAGPGGYAAAFRAADLNLEVILIDSRIAPGGVCLYEGCIPSKAYLHATSLLQETQESHEFGIHFQPPEINIEQLRQWKTKIITKLSSGLTHLTKSRKIQYIQGHASFINTHQIEIKTKQETKNLTFKNAILATGSVPTTIPNLPKSKKIINSTEALDMDDIPKQLTIIGGGYIGLEMASVYASFGSQVTIIEAESCLLSNMDQDLVKPLQQALAKSCKIYLNTYVQEVSEKTSALTIKAIIKNQNNQSKELTLTCDKLLVSVGRKPSTAKLGLDKTPIKINKEGFIIVDQQCRTSEPSIYAIGDLIGNPMLAHKASYEGKVAAEVIAGKKVCCDAYTIPAVVFTHPEIAFCGLTKEDAELKGYKVQTASFPWNASGKALTMQATNGLTKMIIDATTKRVLGVGIVGKGASELIAEAVVAIEMGALVDDIALSIHPHPTLSETMMETSEIFSGLSTHIK